MIDSDRDLITAESHRVYLPRSINLGESLLISTISFSACPQILPIKFTHSLDQIKES